MPDVVHTKLFRTGGSVALRIPAGWLNPDEPVTLHRDPHTGRIYANQGESFDVHDFFDFLRGEPFLDDPAMAGLLQREEPPRTGPLERGEKR